MLAALGEAAASAAPKIIGDAASGVANSGTYGAENTATVPLAPQATGQAETTAVNAIPQAAESAAGGLQRAAATEQKLATPVGGAVSQAGQQTQKMGVEFQSEAIKNYQRAVNQTNAATINAESALEEAKQKATIDPQNYLKVMGVGLKTLTVIGLALSGIGSGLTGQPNLAIKSVQDNINRDIEAQKRTFQNAMETAAAEKGLLQSAQDRQNIALQAANMATLMVTNGANTAIQGLQTQVAGATAKDTVQQLLLQNQQAAAKALSDINTKYVQTIKSGNQKQVNQLGLGFDAASEQLRGKGLGLNPNPLGAATSQGQGNPILNPEAPSAPSSIPIETKAAAPATSDFLDAIAKSRNPFK